MGDQRRLCAVVPTYRHARMLPSLTAHLRAHCERVFIVDDGNGEPEKSQIWALHDPGAGIEVLRQTPNQGKGVAMATGFRAAIAQGFTHAIQLDADGQHDPGDLPRFAAASAAHPSALICGQAVYDESVPKARKFGRYLTHVWVWIETMSFDIADSMCGYRVYPLALVARLLGRAHIGARMDFDTEIAVRLHWLGAPVVNVPTKVIYPAGNVSNFDMLMDNVRITAMHTRLAIQMPIRAPMRVFYRWKAGRKSP